MRTPPCVALLALLLAGAACASDPGTSGSPPATGCTSCTDASSPATHDATVADTSAPDTGKTPDAGPPGEDASDGAAAGPQFNILAIGHLIDPDGTDDGHAPFVRAATTWLKGLTAQNNFTFDSLVDPYAITDDSLKPYNLILQLNYPPFDW